MILSLFLTLFLAFSQVSSVPLEYMKTHMAKGIDAPEIRCHVCENCPHKSLPVRGDTICIGDVFRPEIPSFYNPRGRYRQNSSVWEAFVPGCLELSVQPLRHHKLKIHLAFTKILADPDARAAGWMALNEGVDVECIEPPLTFIELLEGALKLSGRRHSNREISRYWYPAVCIMEPELGTGKVVRRNCSQEFLPYANRGRPPADEKSIPDPNSPPSAPTGENIRGQCKGIPVPEKAIPDEAPWACFCEGDSCNDLDEVNKGVTLIPLGKGGVVFMPFLILLAGQL